MDTLKWAATLALVPKLIISFLVILLAALVLWMLWAPHPYAKERAAKASAQPAPTPYTATVTSFEQSQSIQNRLSIIAALNSTGFKVRDAGKAWRSPEEAWDSWESSVYPKLSLDVIEDIDVFILHRGSPEQAQMVQEAISGMFPKLKTRVLRHGESKTPYISVYVSSAHPERFKIN